MKRLHTCTGWLAAVLLSLPPAALAQRPEIGRKAGMPRYNTATEAKLQGAVEKVLQEPHHRMTGLHLTVRTSQGVKEVWLGPSQFVSGKGFSFAPGDQIEITGSPLAVDGTEVIIAREIIKGGKTLTLRDAQGRPVWAGRGWPSGG